MGTSLLRKAVQVALGAPAKGKGKGARGTVSNYVAGSPPEFGQPRTQQLTDATGALVSPLRMREITMKSPTVAGCVNSILDYACSVDIKVRNVDASRPADPDKVIHVKSFLSRPNDMDSKLHYKYKLFRDMIALGYAALEMEPNTTGGLYGLNVLDSARLYIDFDEAGKIEGFDMLNIHGMPTRGGDGKHAWKPGELLYFNCNPISDSAYSTSKISQLFAAALIENLMLHFIGSRFTDSNVPYGLLDIGDVSEQELLRAVQLWNDQAEGPHQIVLTGSKGGAKWMPFAYALKDLEASALLKSVQSYIMQVLGVTKNELGDSQDVSKSNGYNLSYTFKRRAIEPVLNEFVSTMSRSLLWERLGYDDLELYYDEIDSRDQLLQAQIDKLYVDMGVWSINHVRNRQGEPNVPGGEEPKIILASGAIPVSLIDEFAWTQLALLQTIEGTPNADGTPGPAGKVSPPIVRAPQSPMKFGTPDASGGANAKVTYNTPQAAKGPVQANRNAGSRPPQEENKS